MANESSRLMKVGALVAVSLATLMASLFFIGSEEKTFSKKYEYQVLLESAAGLAEGNPVQMAGVTVGSIKDIQLPRDPKKRNVTIVVTIQKKYAERVRIDSRAKLRKLGLIAADAYIDVTLGSPNQPVLEPGSVIPSAKATNVDALISSGEDLVGNLVQISYSLKNILQRVDRGEGLLGELTTQPATRQRITDTLLVTLNRTNTVLDDVRGGKGLVGRLIYDETFARDLTASIQQSATSMQAIMGNLQRGVESGEGMVPALLNDPRGRRDVLAVVQNLRLASENVAALTAGMQTGEGLVPRLLNDREYADQTLTEFRTLVARLNEMARKLNEGEGTAGRLIADPSIYESINDILIGINESKLLRWLIRNRQQKGIETRYDAARSGEQGTQRSAPPTPAPQTAPENPPPVLTPPPPAPEATPPTGRTPAEPPASVLEELGAATEGSEPSPTTTTSPPPAL